MRRLRQGELGLGQVEEGIGLQARLLRVSDITGFLSRWLPNDGREYFPR